MKYATVIAAFAALFVLQCNSSARETSETKMETVKNMINEGALVLDVRSPMEYNMGHYPEAINIPITELQKRVNEVGDSGRAIVVYCASGARSETARNFLRSMGYSNVVNAGGLADMPR
ncbi:MAG: rhodanese-like domain-containing protein [Leptospiraceae bacterium]|nr:rhodanese-like domain-containing protein [Leptospiraceae bacterium]MCB1304694.1 rhodanese-like domain-containing protein [Leptospiraceae bacterium]